MITILINVLLIPVYGYMASAWAHVASYGVMIIMSFIFARNHFRINYNMKSLIPYFILAIGMVVFSRVFRYGSLFTELIINTFFILIFIIFAQFKDQTISIFEKGDEMKIKIVNRSKHDLPSYATIASAGMDLRANLKEPVVLKPMQRIMVPTGLYIEIPVGYEAQIRPRSGLAFNYGIGIVNARGLLMRITEVKFV